jgi:hypothetical protein
MASNISEGVASMMRSLKKVCLSGLVLMCTVSVTHAQTVGNSTYDSLWHQALAGADCVQSDHGDFTLVWCESSLTYWYFTKPNHPAHPGVIRRILAQEPDGSWVAHEEGSSFGPDSTQPAFKAWLAQIADLDRQMREQIERQQSAPSPPKSN